MIGLSAKDSSITVILVYVSVRSIVMAIEAPSPEIIVMCSSDRNGNDIIGNKYLFREGTFIPIYASKTNFILWGDHPGTRGILAFK